MSSPPPPFFCRSIDCWSINCRSIDCRSIDCRSINCRSIDCRSIVCRSYAIIPSSSTKHAFIKRVNLRRRLLIAWFKCLISIFSHCQHKLRDESNKSTNIIKQNSKRLFKAMTRTDIFKLNLSITFWTLLGFPVISSFHNFYPILYMYIWNLCFWYTKRIVVH